MGAYAPLLELIFLSLCSLLCLSLFMAFVIKSVLPDMNIATFALSFPFAWNTAYPLAFNVYIFSSLKRISCRQYIEGFLVVLFSLSLCVLIGELVHLPLTYLLIIIYCHFKPVFQLIPLYSFFIPVFLFFSCGLMFFFSVTLCSFLLIFVKLLHVFDLWLSWFSSILTHITLTCFQLVVI